MSKCNYKCKQCNNKYSNKSLLQQHEPICIFLHSSSSNEKSLQIPSQEIMFQYIIHLTKKYEKLEEKMKNIERITNYKKKTYINDTLKHMKKPNITYLEWVNKIEVSDDDLEKLFENDLKTCIIHIISNILNSNMPLVAFEENKNIIYTYENDRWRCMTTEEFARFISILSQKILKKYVCWANENEDFLQENSKNQELTMVYMSKANGLGCNLEKVRAEIKKWMFSKMCVSMKDIE